MLIVRQGGIKYYFWVFGMTRPGIEPRFPGTLANTLLRELIKDKVYYGNETCLMSLK